MMCAAEQGLNGTVNIEYFCSWLSVIVMLLEQGSGYEQKAIIKQAKNTKLETKQRVYWSIW
jgi:hypothetical protein